jgi:Tol biopolymer transport system component
MQPVWSPDGKRISYYNNNIIFSVDVQDAGSSLAVGKRDSLFSIVFGGNATTHQQYDIAPDGRYVDADLGGGELRLKFVTNWMREVRQKLKYAALVLVRIQ